MITRSILINFSITLNLLSGEFVLRDQVIPEFRTAKQVYIKVVVKAIEPDGIRISHESGFAKVGFDDLAHEQRVTYGLTAEKRDEYIQRQRKEARVAAATAEQSSRQNLASSLSKENLSPRYITSQQIKVYWYNQLPMPRTMDRNFHSARKERAQFVADIRRGLYDLTAEKTTATYNKQEALAFKDLDRAKLCEIELASIVQQEAELQRAEDAQKASLATEELNNSINRQNNLINRQNNEISSLQATFDSLNSDISRIRSKIWSMQ